MKPLDPSIDRNRRSQRKINRSIDRCRISEWAPELLMEGQGDWAVIRATVRTLVRHIHNAHSFAVNTAYTPVNVKLKCNDAAE